MSLEKKILDAKEINENLKIKEDIKESVKKEVER